MLVILTIVMGVIAIQIFFLSRAALPVLNSPIVRVASGLGSGLNL